jgi:signal transduction histidine kinase
MLRAVPDLRRRIRTLRWVIPIGLALLVIVYEFGPTRFIHDNLGFFHHAILDSIVFATVGPLLAYFVLTLLERWLDERETSDLQAQLVDQARRQVRESRDLSDDAIQVLFSAGALIEFLENEIDDMPGETSRQVALTKEAVGQTIEELRRHLVGEGQDPVSERPPHTP